MQRIVYVNGAFVPENEAKISIFDRGFLFADGVYEVTGVLQGRMIENNQHLRRLHRSLSELNLPAPFDDQKIIAVQEELIRRNRLEEGIVYLQVTRGAADRDFAYPEKLIPSLVAFTQVKSLLNAPVTQKGLRIITVPDIRWGRPDIKTVGLLAASMAKMQAIHAGKDDAWLVDPNGRITEATASNAYIITNDNKLITRHLSKSILSGITRQSMLALARENNISFEERPFTVDEAQHAKEAFMTGSAAFVVPIVEINNYPVGTGKPGELTQRLHRLYTQMALAQTATK